MVEDKVGIKDELGKLTEEEYKKSLENELEMFKSNIEDTKKTRDRYIKQNERQRELWDIMRKGYRTTEPKMVYEADDRFWELQLELFEEKIKQEEVQIEGTLKRFQTQIAVNEEQQKEKEFQLSKLEE